MTSKQPMSEVFGYPIDNFGRKARHFRENKLCPFGNKVPNCTKNSVSKPLGVCSIFDNTGPVITCPIRFREDWLITADAARFCFPNTEGIIAIPEIRLKDKNNKPVGNIDFVLIEQDKYGRISDFSSVEIQSVYISGNITGAFDYYMENPDEHYNMSWEGEENYPRPDYLSSSLKRLVPQIIAKGAILRQWKKKQVVATQSSFFNTLPSLPQVNREEADMAWLVYDLKRDNLTNIYELFLDKTIYTNFDATLRTFTTYEAGSIDDFIKGLEQKIKKIKPGQVFDRKELGDIVIDGLH